MTVISAARLAVLTELLCNHAELRHDGGVITTPCGRGSAPRIRAAHVDHPGARQRA